ITDRTKLLFAEVVANPSGEVADIAALADVAHAAGLPLVVDATTATPYLCRPIEHGADIVIHSATKFLGGHGTTLGGVVVGAGRPDHPHHHLAARYLPLGPGAVFAFGVQGGRAAGQRFIEALQLCSHLANIGDARTLVIHPGSTTHQQLTDDQLRDAGVPPD